MISEGFPEYFKRVPAPIIPNRILCFAGGTVAAIFLSINEKLSQRLAGPGGTLQREEGAFFPLSLAPRTHASVCVIKFALTLDNKRIFWYHGKIPPYAADE